MKRCPECSRTYSDDTLAYCLYDGKPLCVVTQSPESEAGRVPVPPASPVGGQSGSDLTLPPLAEAAMVQKIAGEPERVATLPPSAPTLTPPAPVSPPPAAPAPRRKIAPAAWLIGLLILVILYQQGKLAQARREAAPVVGQPEQTPAEQPARPEQPAVTPTERPDASTQAEVLAAVRLSDDAEAQALKTLDPAPLAQSYSGAALQAELAKVTELSNRGMYADNQLVTQQVQSVTFSPDGAQAQARVTETWSSAFYNAATRQSVGVASTHTVPQTIFLERNEGKWMVYDDKP